MPIEAKNKDLRNTEHILLNIFSKSLYINVLNNRVYGLYCNVIKVHNENTHRLWGYGSVGQLLNIVLVTLRRAGY